MAGENAPKGCDQTIKFDRFSVELIAPGRERLVALTGERVRGQRDNGGMSRVWGLPLSLRVASQPSTTGISR